MNEGPKVPTPSSSTATQDVARGRRIPSLFFLEKTMNATTTPPRPAAIMAYIPTFNGDIGRPPQKGYERRTHSHSCTKNGGGRRRGPRNLRRSPVYDPVCLALAATTDRVVLAERMGGVVLPEE